MSQVVLARKDINCSRFTQAAFDEVKAAFPDQSDEKIAMFLLGRKGDAAKACDMLRDHLIWRAQNWPVLKTSCLTEINKHKFYLHGQDKEGYPLMIWRASKHKHADRDKDEMTRMIIWWTEVMIQNLPADKSKYTFLIDRSDFTTENQDLEFMQYFMKTFQDNYPERLHKCYVHPTGVVFWALWEIVKNFLDPVTVEKVCPYLYFYAIQGVVEDQFIPRSMGGQSDFEPNTDAMAEPYSADVLAAIQPAAATEGGGTA